MCMAESNFSKRMAFAFLEDIKENFGGKYTYEQKINSIAFSLNNSFYTIIKEKMVDFYRFFKLLRYFERIITILTQKLINSSY